ncbi:MAG: polya polymerase [Bacilli bacterium]|jgi:hypothetical protein|nr:polya polymerase [Bacilli bacterium]
MKFYNLKNVDEFLKVLDNCKGVVELISKDGDRLNLKSKLSQYVGLSKLFHDAHKLDLEIIAHEQDDVALLVQFLITN